jgi:hypothetical protein
MCTRKEYSCLGPLGRFSCAAHTSSAPAISQPVTSCPSACDARYQSRNRGVRGRHGVGRGCYDICGGAEQVWSSCGDAEVWCVGELGSLDALASRLPEVFFLLPRPGVWRLGRSLHHHKLICWSLEKSVNGFIFELAKPDDHMNFSSDLLIVPSFMPFCRQPDSILLPLPCMSEIGFDRHVN